MEGGLLSVQVYKCTHVSVKVNTREFLEIADRCHGNSPAYRDITSMSASHSHLHSGYKLQEGRCYCLQKHAQARYYLVIYVGCEGCEGCE